MQTEERSTCPSCGGDNPKVAAFCWRCYTSLTVPGASPRVPMPSPPSMPVPPMSSSGPSTLARLVVGAAVSLIAAFGVRSVFDGGPSLPDAVAGTPRMTTQQIKDFEKEMVEQGEGADLDVAAGAYGRGPVPTFIVLLVEGRSSEATDDIFDQFVGGMASSGATVQSSATESGQHEGLDYRCVPVAAPQIEAAACMWRDDATVGIVFRLDAGIEETRDLLFRTHEEIA